MPEMRVNFAEFPPHHRFPKRNANRQHKMSGMGHQRTLASELGVSALPLKADMLIVSIDVR